jgi:hypothetical protein
LAPNVGPFKVIWNFEVNHFRFIYVGLQSGANIVKIGDLEQLLSTQVLMSAKQFLEVN